MKRKVFVSILCIVCFIVAACSSTKKPAVVADEFITAMKSQDFEKVKSLSAQGDVQDEVSDTIEDILSDTGADDSEDPSTQLFMEKLFDFDYTIGEEKIDGDNATVEVSFKTYDFYAMLGSYLEKAFSKVLELAFSGSSEEEISGLGAQLLEEELGALTEKNREAAATLNLVKTDGEWKVTNMDENTEFLDGMFGGLFSIVNALDEMGDKLSGIGE